MGRKFMNYIKVLIIFLIFTSFHINSVGQIKRIWLTHGTNDPTHVVINWQSERSGSSEVLFRSDNDKEYQRILVNEETKLHHVEIPLREKDVQYHYKVMTGQEESEMHRFKSYPTGLQELRIAIVGNWGFAENPDLSQLLKDNPHLLITLGDNIKNFHESCGEGVKDCIEPYLKLIDSAQELFQTTLFMPILGNHDKQIRNRGEKYPPLPVYDIDAIAYRNFFELPDDEWKWHFKIPDFKVGFVALDLNHIVDIGTTWQSCHDFHIGSEQMEWYRTIMNKNPPKYRLITLNNVQNQQMRKQENGEWQTLFEKGTAVITGFGYYSERANVKGFPYFNTSLKAGDQYPDEFSAFLEAKGGYILMEITKEKITVEMKSLQGEIMERFILK